MLRIGQGFDMHRLVAGRPLRLGCVEIPFDKGALGHSDGDAAAHALCDALLGAAGLGDMGAHFPSTDERFRGVTSDFFLREVAAKLAARGAKLVNADLTIVIEKPRLLEHLPSMQAAMAAALSVDPACVSVKAKSGDGVGPIGQGDAVAAFSVALIEVYAATGSAGS